MILSIAKSLIITLSLLAIISVNHAAAEIAVIVNPSNEAAIDAGTIKKLYLGKKKSFSNGVSAHILTQKGETGEEFTTKCLHRSLSQFKAYWAKRAFSGKGKPPKSLSNSAEIKAFVASNPNAIGFIDATELDDSVKVILSQ